MLFSSLSKRIKLVSTYIHVVRGRVQVSFSTLSTGRACGLVSVRSGGIGGQVTCVQDWPCPRCQDQEAFFFLKLCRFSREEPSHLLPEVEVPRYLHLGAC